MSDARVELCSLLSASSLRSIPTPLRKPTKACGYSINFPSDRVEKLHGFRPDQPWLDRVRLSAVKARARLLGRVSSRPRGLVQTNHHCAEECLQQLLTKREKISSQPASMQRKRRTRPNARNSNSISLSPSATLRPASARRSRGRRAKLSTEAKRAVKAAIAKECSGGNDALRCDVVELYEGGIYNLYKYRRFQDVRLVFAPEQAIAFFGGDPDNFEFPELRSRRELSSGLPGRQAARHGCKLLPLCGGGRESPAISHLRSAIRARRNASIRSPNLNTTAMPRCRAPFSGFPSLGGCLRNSRTKGAEEKRIATGRLFGVENSTQGEERPVRGAGGPGADRRLRRTMKVSFAPGSTKTPP